MIEFPRRSVTRFFIPMIDVLTLLFCIFLLMPLVKATGGNAEPESPPIDTLAEQDRQELGKLRREKSEWHDLNKLQGEKKIVLQDLERLRQEKVARLPERLHVCVLQIEGNKLYFYNPAGPKNPRIEITDKSKAREWMESRKRDAGNKELFFLFLRPRLEERISGFPTSDQLKEYDDWFHDVAHGVETLPSNP